jgi:hydrogenase small subunit
MDDQTLLWIGCGGCSGETQAIIGVEGQSTDLLDLLDRDGVRLLWHPSLSEAELWPVVEAVMDGSERLTLLCVEGSVALADDGLFDMLGEHGKDRVVRALCERADFVVALGVCSAFGGWQAQPPNPSGAVGLQFTLAELGGLLGSDWRSRGGLPVICVAGCPVPADVQVGVMRWVLSGAPGGLDRYGRPPLVLPCLPSPEYRGCGTPRQIGLRCYGCTGPSFPAFREKPFVRWTT